MAKSKDKWAQLGYLAVTESAIGTLTFASMSVFSNILTPKGLLIHKIEYNIPTAALALLVATPDEILVGIAGDDSMATIALDDAQVYDYKAFRFVYAGTSDGFAIDRYPAITDYTSLPGGGRLVPADRLYAYVIGTSIGAPVTMQLRFHFTIVDLSAQEYIELAQALRVLT